MLKEGTRVYFLVNGYVLNGTVMHVEGTKQQYTFQIEGYGGCGGNHVLDCTTLHRTVFLSEEEAAQYKDQEARFLEGYC